jgi:accessory gene regulator protein AgrB
MPNDVKAILSIITLIVGTLIAYWEVSIGKGHLFWLIIGFAIFAVVAMWVFPEAQTKKKDLAGKIQK